MTLPMLIAVSPNGARKTRADHPALPLTPLELADTAVACAEAGAGMIHFHVRDASENHTLDPDAYRPVLRELEAAVGDRMLFQVSSEAAGRYRPEEQMERMKRLSPHCLSCGVRELVADQTAFEAGRAFFTGLCTAGILIQYILYSPEDVAWYETLCREGVIPGETHFLLFVIGRYDRAEGDDLNGLPAFIGALKRNSPWMVCAFGTAEHRVVRQAAFLGGHARVGFENNLFMPDGSTAPDNETLVRHAVATALSAGRSIGRKGFAEALHFR